MLSQGSSAAAVNETSKRMTESECSNEPNTLWIMPFLQIFAVYVLDHMKRMKVL